MKQDKNIIVTGAAGFIGSCMVGYLNSKGFENIYIVDEFEQTQKTPNYSGKQYRKKIERDLLFNWLQKSGIAIDFVFHLGARTDTTEFDYAVHQKLNVEYSQALWHYCTLNVVPLIYASSAATYGSGDMGYKDDHHLVEQLQPLNPYGVSKNEFDKWALQQKEQPPFWAGLKFFNVYGPNEYHKGRMASVIFHAFPQIQKDRKVKLFRSHRPDFKDGEQLRDFVYVKDVVEVCYWLMQHQPASGLYNVGTGQARTFKDLVTAIFDSLTIPPDIEYIDMPEDIRDKYQYFTEADMNKLKTAGYTNHFYSLEEGVKDYVQQFLVEKKYY